MLAFHGSQKLPPFTFSKETPLYCTSDFKLAKLFATREYYSEKLIPSEFPVVYTVYFSVEDFKILYTNEEYENFFTDVSDWKKFAEEFKGLIYEDYYCIFPTTDKVIIEFKKL